VSRRIEAPEDLRPAAAGSGLVFSSRLTIWRNGIKASDAGGVTDFAWFVWDRSYSGPTTVGWIDP
jgi:hypothetical protein